MELPLTPGVAGAVLLPGWVAVGAVAALAADYRIAVEQPAIPLTALPGKRPMGASVAEP